MGYITYLLKFKAFLRIKNVYAKYERVIMPVAFFTGFILDNITLRRIDLWLQNVIFIADLAGAIAAISALHAHSAGHMRGKISLQLVRFAPYVLQFVFGGLFSAFLVFYSRSSSIFASWPFLLFLAALFIGNEIFKKSYARLTFQLSIFFIALFSYAVFALPILLGKMGTMIFLLSGALALILLAGLVYALKRIAVERIAQSARSLIFSIASIYLLFQIFYFTNIIPPIPLALKESGVFHSLERITDNKGRLYKVSFEQAPSYLFFKDQANAFHWIPGEKIYAYSAVFAPTKFNLKIFHRWLYFDEGKSDWLEKTRVEFPIIGGRDGGYRGYSFKTNIQPGKWRVEVITQTDQIIGQRTFNVVQSTQVPLLKIELR